MDGARCIKTPRGQLAMALNRTTTLGVQGS